MKNKYSPPAYLACLVAAPFFIFGIIIVRGWAIKTMWAWFIIPQFAAKPLSIAMAIGVSAVASMMLSTVRIPKKDDRDPIDSFIASAAAGLFAPLVAVLCGLVTKSFL